MTTRTSSWRFGVLQVDVYKRQGEFYTFESKYEDEESKTCIPALVDQAIQEKIRQYALRAFQAIDGHGLSRVDFFLDKQTGAIYLNEMCIRDRCKGS